MVDFCMKRIDLVRHLEANGCVLIREGAKHGVYYNPSIQRTSAVPRHREVKNPTAIRILQTSRCFRSPPLNSRKPVIMASRLPVRLNPGESVAKKFLANC